MVKILAILGMLATGLLLFTLPWLSALSYSAVSILQPQYIWFWSFTGIPMFKITAGMAIIAWFVQALRGNVNWKVYGSGQCVALIILTIIMNLSETFTPFQDYFAGIGASIVLQTMNTILIMYLVVVGLVNQPKSLDYFAYMLIFITGYYVYWANSHYLTGNWAQFTRGRLNGTPSGPYRDGNTLSVVLIIGMPFLLFGIQYFKSKVMKATLILLLPLLWHALILFASRGALLSAAVVTLFAATLIKSKALNTVLVLGFIAALITQGGAMVERATKTVEKSRVETEQPLNPRLVSWQVGSQLALKYPILGVGPQRFQKASALHFPGLSPHVAHNTFLNFAANTGILAGLLYLYFFYKSFRQYRYLKTRTDINSVHGYINNSCICALLGYFIGAFFLDMIIFEPFYFILLLISANYYMVRKAEEQETKDDVQV